MAVGDPADMLAYYIWMRSLAPSMQTSSCPTPTVLPAPSQDGRNWARIEADHHTGALFDVGEEGEWDEAFIASPQVVAAGPRDMRMYYHSYDARKGRYVVGLATSADGFKWDKQGVVFEVRLAGWVR